MSSPALRIASLIPSGTDIAVALDLAEGLVGISHECDHEAARGLPVLTSSIIPAGGRTDAPPPAEIDRLVVEAVREGRSLYRADRELLAALKPDVILSQDVCDVCAVSGDQVRCDVPEGARLVLLTATTLAGLEDDLHRVGEAVGVPERARALSEAIRARLDAVRDRVRGLPRVRALALEWSDPPFLGGHWVPELFDVAGGEHLFSGPGEASRRATWEEIAAADPDVIVFMPCGYGLEPAVAEARALLDRPEVAALRAVREGRFWVTDAHALFSRCTPVVARSAEVLAGILHPEACPPPDPREAVPLEPVRT